MILNEYYIVIWIGLRGQATQYVTRAGYAPMLSPTRPAKKMFDRMSVRRYGRMDV